MSNKKETPILPPKQEVPCRVTDSNTAKTSFRKSFDAFYSFPRGCKFAFMTPGYYATGFRILDVYKTEVDFTEMRRLLFIEDPKWMFLKSRIPYSESRVTNLFGTRDLQYNNYCMRCLTPESAMSWRKSILKPKVSFEDPCKEENEMNKVTDPEGIW